MSNFHKKKFFMKAAFTFIMLVLLITSVSPQPRAVRFSNKVIIDTDCGFDDFRALSLLLADPEITIKGILTSDGSLSPADGARKVRSLLSEFGRNDIPVAVGDSLKEESPAWRQFNKDVSWGENIFSQVNDQRGPEFLSAILKNEDQKPTFVCLGPLTNVARAVGQNAGILSMIERIVWYNDTEKPLRGFNYERDVESANSLLKSNIRIDIISNLNKADALFDSTMADDCTKSNTMLARILHMVFSQQPVVEKLKRNHFRLCDDLVALYLTNPELFDINTDMDKLNVRYDRDYDLQGIKAALRDMIHGTYVSDQSIVFNRFPFQHEMFNYDIRPIIDSVIRRYGYEEWKANVMTDEFHGHLGVFSIVGAKMGIKARELFNVGPDMIEVTSFAGSKPPYSCLNDGIQVSTGATVGMGTIHLAGNKKSMPAAVFTYNNRSIRLSLKKEYLGQVDADINEGIKKFGLADDGYWKLIRRNALKYWLEWDRNKIFDIEEISTTRQAPK